MFNRFFIKVPFKYYDPKIRKYGSIEDYIYLNQFTNFKEVRKNLKAENLFYLFPTPNLRNSLSSQGLIVGEERILIEDSQIFLDILDFENKNIFHIKDIPSIGAIYYPQINERIFSSIVEEFNKKIFSS